MGAKPGKKSVRKKATGSAQKKTRASKPRAKKSLRTVTSPVHTGSATADEVPIVAVGASAGGLEALEGLFAKVTSPCEMAFVVIQHLAPEHRSIMGSLLARHTNMSVHEIVDGMTVEHDCIYLNPPNKDVAIMNRVLHLVDPVEARGVRLPIDHFFRALATDQGDKAICIVLSGTGTDGTLGLKAIKSAAGMAMAQDESQAKYSSMPHHAIATGMVDYVLPVEEMPAELVRYIKHPYVRQPATGLIAGEKAENDLQKICLLIRMETGHDFSHYKRNTTRRRIERRMAVHQIEKVGDYIRYLRSTPAEVRALSKDLLITVTSFFRDPEAFDHLREHVIPDLLENPGRTLPVRVWVPGCSTGEEAYSIAMLLVETMERLGRSVAVQMFATDLDEESVEFARMAVYPASVSADVSPARLQRFFEQGENTYKIRKQIREMVVFATQSIIKDAPFSKLDLISCRNLLIYLDGTLQKKVLPLFHYTLNPGGFLFLGTSETIGDSADCFTPESAKWKIFRRKDAVADRSGEHLPPFYQTVAAGRQAGADLSTGGGEGVDLRRIAEKVILQDYGAPCVFVDDKYDILYFHGKTDSYLSQPRGRPHLNILTMVHSEIRYQLSASLHKAVHQKQRVVSHDLQIKTGDRSITFDLIVQPVPEVTKGTLFMVVFEDRETSVSRQTTTKGRTEPQGTDARITTLEKELQSAREYLQTTVEELETSNEELRSTNEELQSTNEELQSTNEELETSREELQSTNEELETVNAELQKKVDELSDAYDDLSNLLASTELGTIFLDNNLNIKRFTPAAKRIFKLIDTDIGRPIGDIVNTLEYEGLLEDVREVLTNLGRRDLELRTADGHWYQARILPYRTLENAIDGVVVTFVDITSQKEAQIYAEAVLETVHEPLLVLDSGLVVLSANRSFYECFRTCPDETLKKRIYDLGNGQWNIPELQKLLEDILPSGSQFADFEVTCGFPELGTRTMLLNGRQVFQCGQQFRMILLALQDVTEHRPSKTKPKAGRTYDGTKRTSVKSAPRKGRRPGGSR